MPKLHGDGKDEILDMRERERESARARREELSFCYQSCERIWRSSVRLSTLKSSNLH